VFKDKKILITGGAGSVGNEILKGLLNFSPRVIRVFDHSEIGLFKVKEKFGQHHNVRFLLGDARDKERLKRAIEDIDLVFHAAALKHVYVCEYNPFEAVKSNIIGTQNLIDVCIDEDVDRVVFTSSDKAVNPNSVMGATKLVAERLIVAANYYKGKRKTAFSNVRFGNVIGSSGSAIPLFTQQIMTGGPVTITHKDMTRFIMTMDDAIRLVFKATELTKGSETFIFKMAAIRIMDLAEVLINELASKAKRPKIKIIGIQPGEKLYEELMTKHEATRAFEIDEMFILPPELVELNHFKKAAFPQGSKSKLQAYTSADVKLMTHDEIRDLLYREKLLGE
jgi:FlaA1/EpsC-like NDP-sugar epimerase